MEKKMESIFYHYMGKTGQGAAQRLSRGVGKMGVTLGMYSIGAILVYGENCERSTGWTNRFPANPKLNRSF